MRTVGAASKDLLCLADRSLPHEDTKVDRMGIILCCIYVLIRRCRREIARCDHVSGLPAEGGALPPSPPP